jgi:hypothetical protein
MTSNMEYNTGHIMNKADFANAMKNATMNSANDMLNTGKQAHEQIQTGLASVGKNWNDIKTQLNKFQEMDGDETSKMISGKLLAATNIMIKVIDRLKNDKRLKNPTTKLFCLLGESFKDVLLILSDLYVKIAPPAIKSFEESLKTTIPLLQALIEGSKGTLKELIFVPFPFVAPILNLVETGGAVGIKATAFFGKLNTSISSALTAGTEALGVISDPKTQNALKSIFKSLGDAMQNVSQMMDRLVNATALEESKNIPVATGKPVIATGKPVVATGKPVVATGAKGGGKRRYRKLRGGESKRMGPKDPTLPDVIKAWSELGIAAFDVLDIQGEANIVHQELIDNIKELEKHMSKEKLLFAFNLTQKYMDHNPEHHIKLHTLPNNAKHPNNTIHPNNAKRSLPSKTNAKKTTKKNNQPGGGKKRKTRNKKKTRKKKTRKKKTKKKTLRKRHYRRHFSGKKTRRKRRH